MQVQSVLFPLDKFNMREAKKWIREHGYKDHYYRKQPEILDKYIRFRQKKPDKSAKYKTKVLDNGILLVLMFS